MSKVLPTDSELSLAITFSKVSPPVQRKYVVFVCLTEGNNLTSFSALAHHVVAVIGTLVEYLKAEDAPQGHNQDENPQSIDLSQQLNEIAFAKVQILPVDRFRLAGLAHVKHLTIESINMVIGVIYLTV